jgi:hypothetical protein
MKHFQILGGLLLSAGLLVPAARAEDKRYYHKEGKDYHVYNSQEDRAYRAYLEEQHQKYNDFHRQKRVQQEQYFKWRHEHSDSILKIEVR